MAQRWTNTDAWDDDWYLELPPVMKCAWKYICDNCDGGTGIIKISFRKMSDLIKGEVTREEFDRHLGSRVHWVNSEMVWIPGYLKAQFKKLTPRNKAHVNMAKKVIEIIGDQALSDRSKTHFDALMTLVRDSLDAQPTLDRPSIEGQESLIGYGIQDKGKELGIGESEGKGISPARLQDARFQFDFNALFDRYPRCQKKTQSIALMAEKIKTLEEYDKTARAIDRYRAYCEREGTEFSKILTFPNWWLERDDWLDPRAGVPSVAAEGSFSAIDWSRYRQAGEA